MPIMSSELQAQLEAGDITLVSPENVHHRTKECNTPLHILIKHGYVDSALTCLNRFSANAFLFNDDHESPLELAFKLNHKPLILAILVKGPAIPVERIASWIGDAVVRCKAQNSDQQTKVLYALTNRLCGIDIAALLTAENSTYRHAYLAHLVQYKGQSGEGTNLEGFTSIKLLPLRILSWLKILIDIQRNVLRPEQMAVLAQTAGVIDAKGTDNFRQLSQEESGKQILQLIHQTLISYLIQRAGMSCCLTASRAEYLKALALGIGCQVKALQDNENIIIPLSWIYDDGSGHALYLSIAKRAGVWQLWVNNRGGDYGADGHQYLGIPGSGKAVVYPYGVATISTDTSWDENKPGMLYLQAVIAQAFAIQKDLLGRCHLRPRYLLAKAVYYDLGVGKLFTPDVNLGIDRLNTAGWQPLCEQKVGNCTLESNNTAIFYALPTDIAQTFFNWLGEQEASYSGAIAWRAKMVSVSEHPFDDASTMAEEPVLYRAPDAIWYGPVTDLQAYLSGVLADHYSRYKTPRLLPTEQARRDYYVSVTLTDVSNIGSEKIECADANVLAGDVQLLYLEGPAGSGKSTWCAQVAKSYGLSRQNEGQIFWPEYDWLLLVSLPQLQKRCEILATRGKTLIKEDLWALAIDRIEITPELLMASPAFQKLPGRVVFIFDGLDECDVRGEFGKQLKGLLQLGTAIVVSRPQPFPWPGLGVQKYISLEGFSERQRALYVQDYLGPRAIELTALLEAHLELQPLTRIPVFLEMLCYCVKHMMPAVPVPEFTSTVLYQNIFLHPKLAPFFFYRSVDRIAKEVVAASVAARRNFVEAVAVTSWEKGQKVLMSQDVEQCTAERGSDLGRLLLDLGVWRAVTHEDSVTERQWEFAHRSIQEFFVASYYAQRLQKKWDPTVVTRLLAVAQKDVTTLVLPFLVGLLTRAPYQNEVAAKQLCASVRTCQEDIVASPSLIPIETVTNWSVWNGVYRYARLEQDRIWFQCLTEVPLEMLKTWGKYEILSWSLTDPFANIRLKASLESAWILGCVKFQRWAQEQYQVDLATLPRPRAHLTEWPPLFDWYYFAPSPTIKRLLTQRPELLRQFYVNGHSDNLTVLDAAVVKGDLELTQWCLRQCPSLLSESYLESNKGTIENAARLGNFDIVKFLVAQAPYLVGETYQIEGENSSGTLLHLIIVTLSHCGVYLQEDIPDIRTLFSKQIIIQNTAYIRVKDSLFYMCRSAKLCVEVALTEAVRVQFDQTFQPTSSGQGMLSPGRLAQITALTGHIQPIDFDTIAWCIQQQQQLLAQSNGEGDTVLSFVVQRCDFRLLEWLLVTYPVVLPQLQMSNNQGDSFLHVAVRSLTVPQLERLLIIEPQLTTQWSSVNQKGDTIFNESLHSLALAQWVVEQDANYWYCRNANSETVLHIAVSKGNLEVVEWIVTTHPEFLDVKDEQGKPALFRAVEYGSRSIIEFLAEQKAELLLEKDNHGESVLAEVVFQGSDVELVRWLIAVSPEKKLFHEFLLGKMHQEMTYWHLVASGGSLTMLKTMVEWVGGILKAGGHPELLVSLVSAPDQAGATILHYAVSGHGELALVQWLIEQFPHLLLCKTTTGQTVLHAAVSGGNREIILWLIAKIPPEVLQGDALDQHGRSVLFYAITGSSHNKLELTQWLVYQYPVLWSSDIGAVLCAAIYLNEREPLEGLCLMRPDLLSLRVTLGKVELTLLQVAVVLENIKMVEWLVYQHPALLRTGGSINEVPTLLAKRLHSGNNALQVLLEQLSKLYPENSPSTTRAQIPESRRERLDRHLKRIIHSPEIQRMLRQTFRKRRIKMLIKVPDINAIVIQGLRLEQTMGVAEAKTCGDAIVQMPLTLSNTATVLAPNITDVAPLGSGELSLECNRSTTRPTI